jgi:hypothetical protein
MKIMISMIVFALSASSAFAAKKSAGLCEIQARQAVSPVYRTIGETKPNIVSINGYYVGKNLGNPPLIIYTFNVRTESGASFAIITLTQKDCRVVSGEVRPSQPEAGDDVQPVETPWE